jgi:hypothetical protein
MRGLRIIQGRLIKVDLKGDLFSYEIDEVRKKYLEMPGF